MVEAEIHNRRGSYVRAYLHFGSRQPVDLPAALEDTLEAVEYVADTRGSDREVPALELLAVRMAGLRERLDASTVDVAVRLRQRGHTLQEIAEHLHTVRATIGQWLRELHHDAKRPPS